ncbi:hypothetical protein ACXV6R_000815 [Yersinia enterocolitica]
MSGHGRPRKARLSMDSESRWFVSPKDAGGLPAGQYFAQARDCIRGHANGPFAGWFIGSQVSCEALTTEIDH